MMIPAVQVRVREFALSWRAASWYPAICPVLAWFPAGALGVYLKHLELAKQYLPIARSIGRHGAGDLSFMERLTFFRLDILVCLVAIPLVLALLGRFLAPRLHRAVVLTFSIGFALLFFTDFESLGNVGRYLSGDLMADAVNWGLAEPWYITEYIAPGAMAKLAAVIAAIVIGALPWGLDTRGYAGLSRTNLRQGKASAFLGGVTLSLGVAALAWLPDFPALPQQGKPAIETALSSLLQAEGTSRFEDMAPERVVATYRDFARSPEPRQWPAFTGRESGSDVIFFVFETGPGRSLDLTGDMHDFPNLQSLRQRSFVAEKHHSTYPYTSDAVFSLFTSFYAADIRANVVKHDGKMLNSGVFSTLRDAGYATSVHYPGNSVFENDKKMYAGLGVDRQFAADSRGAPSDVVRDMVRDEMDQVSPALKADARRKARLEKILTRDLMALESLSGEISKNKADGRRFVTAYLPQIGHAPWPDIADSGDDYPARGRAVMALQDRWLGALLTMLRRKGWLDNTIIVVTADHGVRTVKEDPRFNGGMISDYSFRVPLLIFAPNTLTRETRIPWLTSHIDITPSVLDLIGATAGRRFEQGSVVWDPRLARRKTFFHAKGYLGADGFHDSGRFYMTNHFLGSVYANRELEFSADNLVMQGDPAHRAVEDTIEFMRNIQVRWRTLKGE